MHGPFGSSISGSGSVHEYATGQPSYTPAGTVGGYTFKYPSNRAAEVVIGQNAAKV